VKNPSSIDMTSFWSMHSWKLVVSLSASQFICPQILRSWYGRLSSWWAFTQFSLWH
jgi:hypothetical protein